MPHLEEKVKDSEASKTENAERLFIRVVMVGAALIMVGFLAVITWSARPSNTGIIGPEDGASKAVAPDHARQLTNFSLTNGTGAKVSLADLRGKYLVVNFLFTGCSLTCPVINRYMAEVQRLTVGDGGVRLVSLTVDPHDDTPTVLTKYAERFGADSNRWYFLTGDQDELYRLIRTSFLNQDLDPSFGYMPGNFSHTDRIAVVDSRGTVRAYFDGLNQNTPAAVTNEIAELRREQR